MTVCVCGCQESAHRSVRMSVALKPNPKPLYPIPATMLMSVARSTDAATYDRRECLCGCGDYLADDEE